MANVDAPSGFTAHEHESGNIVTNEYAIAYDEATKIHTGDFVMEDSGSAIKRATADATLVGRFCGCTYVATDGSIKYAKYWPGAGHAKAGTPKALVEDGPDTVFVGQIDGAVAATDVFSRTNLVVANGNDATGKSIMELDYSNLGAGTGSTLPVEVLGLAPIPGNAWGANAKVLCKIANHARRADNLA